MIGPSLVLNSLVFVVVSLVSILFDTVVSMCFIHFYVKICPDMI